MASIAEVRALSLEQAARGLPVDLEATVTFFRWYEQTLFIQAGDEGVYVRATTDLRLQPGDVIRVRGTTSSAFSPLIVSSAISLLGHGNLPEPIPAKWASLIHGDYDCRWVRVRGTIALAEMSLTSQRVVAHLVLAMEGGMADLKVDNADASLLKGLQGSQVEMTVVAGAVLDGKMEQTGVRLHMPSFGFMKILKLSPMDPWSIPVTPMDRALRGYNVVENTARVRVEGTLTYYRSAEMAVLQDGNKSIRVQTTQMDLLNLGDRVEAIGLPFIEDELLMLKLGQIRSERIVAPILPQKMTWDELTSGKYSFNLVSIEGTVVTQMREHERDVYVISTGAHLISASLRHTISAGSPPLAPMREIPFGTKVRVTGVAALENGNPFNGPIAFTLLLRSVDDITTVARSPWLNVKHLIELVGLLLLAIFSVGMRAWLVERGARLKIAAMAYLEQRRGKILEMINGTQPLADTLERVTELVSASLDGASSWCQVAEGAKLGNYPPNLAAGSLRVIERPIVSRTGARLGSVFAAIDLRSDPRRVETALGLAAGLAKLAIETSHLYCDLVHRSEFDLLTDVANRFSLEKFMDAQIDAARHSASIFGLLYLDLNKFKGVNDRYGHHVGDLYLQEVAQRIKRQLRPGDMLARLGGDEFAALISHVRNRADVVEIAHRLEHCFEEPFRLGGYVLHGSASIGIAMYPEEGMTRDTLLTAADASMYAAKHLRQEV
ncbi:MAG TPA: GGDEF domain-containing protein [Terracidiphilus sp.]|nr:GGDEF domain-containing protein [Terracidiphilus sp.]